MAGTSFASFLRFWAVKAALKSYSDSLAIRECATRSSARLRIFLSLTMPRPLISMTALQRRDMVNGVEGLGNFRDLSAVRVIFYRHRPLDDVQYFHDPTPTQTKVVRVMEDAPIRDERTHTTNQFFYFFCGRRLPTYCST
jgi:hypothetical protein